MLYCISLLKNVTEPHPWFHFIDIAFNLCNNAVTLNFTIILYLEIKQGSLQLFFIGAGKALHRENVFWRKVHFIALAI